MDPLDLNHFVETHHDKSCFIGIPELNWNLQEKKNAVTTCILSIKDHPELSLKALRILSREKVGCEELSLNKSFFLDVLKSTGYIQSGLRSTEGIKLLVNLLFQFETCRQWFNEVHGTLATIDFVQEREDLALNLKILFICTSYSPDLGNYIYSSGLCNDLLILFDSNPSDSIKKDILKLFFNLATVGGSFEELKLFLSTSKLPDILIREILSESAYHEYGSQILMNLPPNSFWFIQTDPIELCNALISRLNLIFNQIYCKHSSFPTTIQLYNWPFDHYISPYFWILNALANYNESLLDYIKESLLPAQL